MLNAHLKEQLRHVEEVLTHKPFDCDLVCLHFSSWIEQVTKLHAH